MDTEKAIESYRKAYEHKLNQEKYQRRLMQNPNYIKEHNDRYRKDRNAYSERRRKMLKSFVPKELVMDIRRWRDRRLLTAQSMADRVGLSKNYVEQILYFKKKPSGNFLKAIGLEWDFSRPTSEYKSIYKTMCRKSGSICFDCATHNCQWLQYEEPVPGWKATKKLLNLGKGYGITETYLVSGCPAYKDSWEKG